MYEDAFLTFPILETDRLKLRQMEMTDLEDMYAYAKHREDFQYTDGFPHDKDEIGFMIGAWRGEAYASKTFIRWGIELKSEHRLIGGVYLYSPSGNDESGRRMDIGYDISRHYCNQGYASEAIRAVTEYGLSHMGLVRVQAQIIPEHIGSIRACEKAGFKREGLLRNFTHYVHNGNRMMDMVIMACIPQDIMV